MKAGERHRVFCASMGDVFEDHPSLIHHRVRLCQLIAGTSHLDWLLLTKRPETAGRLMSMTPWNPPLWPENVWLGTTLEHEDYYQRVDYLMSIPARVRFLSCEPLLGPLDLTKWLSSVPGQGVDWVIVGGESGQKARPMRREWVESIRDQCYRTSTPFFFKQWGAYGEDGVRRSVAMNGNLLDGIEYKGVPGV